MRSKRILLLSTLLKSTSLRNKLKYCKDQRRRNGIIGGMAGLVILLVIFSFFVGGEALFVSIWGFGDMVPIIAGTVIIGASFVFTLLKSNGYLFGFKEYDMLMAMPFTENTIIACKFFYMYTKSILWIAVLNLAAIIGYMIGARGSILTMVLWFLLGLVLPIVPMVLASALGVVIVAIGSRAQRFKQAIQIILTLVFVLPTFFISPFLENLFKNNDEDMIAGKINDLTVSLGGVFPPAMWFKEAVIDHKPLNIVLFIVVTVAVFEIFFVLVSKFYKSINSNLKKGGEHKKYKVNRLKKNSIVKALLLKELKTFTGSTNYFVNVGIGPIILALFTIVAFVFPPEKIIEVALKDAPITPDKLIALIPLVIYFMAGMIPTTVCAPSLEGKHFWILQSLPINYRDDMKAKAIFNLIMELPLAIIATIAVSRAFGAHLAETVIFVMLEIAMIFFSTAYGLYCGYKKKKLDWENDIEVIKQGPAVTLYLPVNMISTMILCGVAFVASELFGVKIFAIVLFVIYALVAFMFYKMALIEAEKGWID